MAAVARQEERGQAMVVVLGIEEQVLQGLLEEMVERVVADKMRQMVIISKCTQ